MKVGLAWHHRNTFFDVTVTGQWSSPSAFFSFESKGTREESRSPSIDRRKDRYFAKFTAEKSLIVLGFCVSLTS